MTAAQSSAQAGTPSSCVYCSLHPSLKRTGQALSQASELDLAERAVNPASLKNIQVISRPGRRVYFKLQDLKTQKQGMV